MRMLTLLGIFIFSISAHAISGRTTYQAKIVKPDGYPLEASSVNFRFTILDPAASCVLYVEDYAAVNMTGTSGLISFALGAGTRTYPVSSTTFASVFDNSTVSFPCQSPGIYNPTLTDARKIVMQFQDSSGWQTLPAMAINAVPFAMYAGKSENSIQLNGKSDTAFVEYSTLASLNCNPATHAITFNGVSFSCIPVGSSSSGITSVTTSGTVLSTGGTVSAPVISIKAVTMSQDGYLTSLDYAEFKAKLSASSTQIINTLGYSPVSGAAVTTQINNSNLSGDVSGTISSNSVVSVGGKTAAQISTSVNDTLAATSSATADTLVKRNSSGNATFNDVYVNAAKINYVDIYKPSTSFNIRLQASTSLSTNYVLNLPTTSGTTGQVLSTDGFGNLSWINPSTGSVVSVSATAPLASTGGAMPTISITQATSSTAGYLSATDFNTFNNKQTATSSAIIATLGYTPADNAASGTYAQKANNLSDLTSSATARINLGLGTLATANSIDLGSASATGIIADARLQTQSNVTSGTQYTKVTVDGKGRVTSGALLSSSDVTTALGYTPANSTSGVTSLNGSVSQTQTFATNNAGTAFGISTSNGVHTFAIPLAASSSVTAGLLSNADYTTFTNKQNATSAAIIATLGYTPANATSATQWTTNGSNIYYNTGNIGVGVINPSAKLELAAGTASVAPLRFTSGTLLSSAQSGTMEYDGFNFYLTDSTNARRTIATGSSAGTIDNASNINSSGNITMTPVGSVIVSSTTASTNSNTGALVVKGGLGVSGNINTAGNLNVSGSQVIDGSLKLSSMTSGSVLFAGANGTVTQDNSALYWDGANKRLGIGSNSPAQTLSVSGSSYFSGNVGIGTTSPSFPLSVSGTIQGRGIGYFTQSSPVNSLAIDATSSTLHSIYTNAPSVDLSLGTNNSTSQLYLKNNGNIGVGTSTPSTKLEVYGTAGPYVGQKISGPGSGAEGLYLGQVSNMYNYIGGNSFYNNVNLWQAKDTAAGSIRFTDGDIGFYADSGLTIDTDYTPTNRMVVKASGNVGIGTTTPSYPLDVNGTIRGAGFAFSAPSGDPAPIMTTRTVPVSQGAATEKTELILFHSNDPNNGAGADQITLRAPALSFQTYNDASVSDINNNNGYNERMYITPTGNVGIGTTTPTYKLSAYDSAAITANVESGGNGTATMLRIAGKTSGTVARSYLAGINISDSNGNYEIYDQTAGASRLYVGSTGNVGIGTSAPSAKLDVNDVNPMIRLSQQSSGKSILSFYDLQAGATRWELYNDGADANKLKIWGFGGLTPLNIDTAGNVGIGTTNPSASLDVGGVFKANIATQVVQSGRISEISGFIETHNNWPTCSLPARIYTIGTFGASDYSSMEIEVTGTHRGLAGYFEHKKWVITVGDRISSKLVDNASSQELVDLWDGASNGPYTDINPVSGKSLQLIVNPYCGATKKFTVKIKYDSRVNFIPATIVSDNFPYVDHSSSVAINTHPLFLGHGNVGIGTTAPQTALHVAKDITSQNAVSGSSLAWNGNSQIKISSGNNALAFSVIGTVNQRLGIIQAGHSGDGLNYYPDLTDPKLALQPYGGNVGIGTTTPGSSLDINGYSATPAVGPVRIRNSYNSGGTKYWQIGPDGNGSGNFVVYTDGLAGAYIVYGQTTWSSSSDRRIKKDIQPITDGLSKLLKLNGVTYHYKRDADTDPKKAGVIAQDVEKVLPEAITKDDKGILSVKYTELIALVIEAVKSLYTQVVGIDRQIASLAESKADKTQIEALKSENQAKDQKIKELELKAKEFDALKVYLCSKDPAAPICK